MLAARASGEPVARCHTIGGVRRAASPRSYGGASSRKVPPMSQLEIWFNPSCSKSRDAREVLDMAGADVVLRDYRRQPPNVAELAALLDKLDAQPWEVCRMAEPVAVTLGLASWPRDTDARQRWLEAMCAHPILIQRPIVVRGERAVIARDPGWRDRLGD
jgi:arsenate reductase